MTIEVLNNAGVFTKINPQVEEIIVEDESIVEQNVFVQEGLIRVNFKSHSPTQALSEYPIQSNDLLLQLVALDPKDDQDASFRRITPDREDTESSNVNEPPLRMHPSWDANGDGLNDCEQDGSCDHTIDYTQAKPEV